MGRTWFLLFSIFIFHYSPKAQDTTIISGLDTAGLPMLTEAEAVATAMQNNYDIILSRNDSAVAALDYAYRNYALLPQVNANGALLRNNNAQNVTLADGTKRNRSGIKSQNMSASVGLNWVVFDGFRMFVTRERAEELVRLGSLVVKEQVNNTIAEVIINYYNIVRNVQQLRAIEEQMAVSQDRYRLARYRFEIGVGIKPEVLQAQIDLNAQKAAQLNQLTLIAQIKQDLNRLMNVAPESDYNVSDTIPIRTDLTLGELQDGLEQSNTQLRIARQNIDLAVLGIQERRAERWPTISLNSAYNFNQNENNSVVNPAQPLTSQNKGFNYGISASIPIFNGFNTRRLIRQAELGMNFQQTLYENQRSLVATGLMNAFRSFVLQRQSLELEQSNIELARENLFIARERYRLAATTFLELREAQRSLEEAYTRLITARYNMKVAETELLRLKGAFVAP